VLAHGCISCNALFTGQFEQALRHGMMGVEIYRKLGSPSLGLLYGFDSGILCYEWTAWTLLIMGFADQANSLYAEVIQTAELHGHPLTVATMRVHFTGFHNLRDDPPETLACARQAVVYATENGILLRTVEAQIMEGWALAETGETEKGIAEIESALVIWRQLGAQIWDPGWYGDLARAYLCADRIGDARNAVAQAFHAANSNGEHAYTAELHRIDGELRSLEGKSTEEIEACFREGIRIAIDQKAKRWELRSATGLARLWKTQGKTTEAHALLASVYNWFTEGFDTRDLKEAKALLHELST
jgi:tetratricopeptide (TPR) repeat protein